MHYGDGNAEELRTAVFNLFDNAIKYSGEKKKIVVDIWRRTLIRCRSAYATTASAFKQKSERIFKRFYRAPNPISREVKERAWGCSLCGRSREGTEETPTPKAREKGWQHVHMRLPRIYQA